MGALEVNAARLQLTAAVERGLGIDYTPQGGLGTQSLRRSAVLILFGALDTVPAAGSAGSSSAGSSTVGTSTVPPELDVLLTRRSDTMRHHPGQIAFPGGGVEPGDADLSATALREAAEETGLDPTGVEVLGSLPEIHIPVSNNLVTPVIGWWRLPSEVAADRRESVEVMRVPVAELVDPGARGTSLLRRGEMSFRSAAFELGPQFGGHLVWGFTGIVLSSLFDGIGWATPWNRRRIFDISVD